MTRRALSWLRRHILLLAAPLWIPGVLVGIAIGEGIREVLYAPVKEWLLRRNSRRADRAWDEFGGRR